MEMLRTPSWRTASLVMVLTAIVGLALPALGDDGRPFRGYYVHGKAITETKLECDALLITTTGSGQATHLRRFTRLGVVVIHADGSADGTAVFTAANGDQLFMEIAGDQPDAKTPATISGKFKFIGGTGRFSEASGEADFVGVFADENITVTFEGTIRY
jgi:hypothetical protein